MNSRALQSSVSSVDGIWRMKYPMKKMPAPRPKTVFEIQVARHLQGGIADVHAVDVVENVQQEQERYEMPRDVPAGAVRQRG